MKSKKCASCGGILVSKKIEYEKCVGSKRMIFENVPASVCASCDEVWLAGSVAEKIEKVFHKNLKPKSWIKIPVWAFPKAA